MELKGINASFEKKERKPPKPSYRSMFGVKDPSKTKMKTKAPKKKILRASSKPKRSY